jgi:hypothetical protein
MDNQLCALGGQLSWFLHGLAAGSKSILDASHNDRHPGKNGYHN